MNIYIVYESESGKAVSTRYVDESDKATLNGLGIATSEYDQWNLGIAENCCVTSQISVSRVQAAELFGRVVIDINTETKQLRSI